MLSVIKDLDTSLGLGKSWPATTDLVLADLMPSAYSALKYLLYEVPVMPSFGLAKLLHEPSKVENLLFGLHWLVLIGGGLVGLRVGRGRRSPFPPSGGGGRTSL